MDRTKASDAFNAGSIPVGCIYVTLIYNMLVYWEPLAAFSFLEREIDCHAAVCGRMRGSMQKNIWLTIRDFIVKHCKIIFPVAVVLVVTVTVSMALKMNHARTEEQSSEAQESSSDERFWFDDGTGGEEDGSGEEGGSQSESDAEGMEEALTPDMIPEVPLQENEDAAVSSLIATYYNALGTGDMETLQSLYDTISENDLQYYKALSEYLDHYTQLQINTKRGLYEGSTVAYIYYRVCFINHEEEFPGSDAVYICTDENGALYIKNEANLTPEEETYITAVSNQADVSDFYNRVKVEYDDLMRENQALEAYVAEVINQVQIDRGVALAGQNQSSDSQTEENGEGQEGGASAQTPAPETQAPATPEYATATTTVNVRSSDSEQADKLGRVSSGTRVKVQEVGVNGWTKVVFEGGDGYIKSEYLEFSESAAGQEVIGKVTATTNINVRAGASQDSEKLGMLTGGESLDLLAVEGDWCKVVFDGQIAYVKAEFVQQS